MAHNGYKIYTRYPTYSDVPRRIWTDGNREKRAHRHSRSGFSLQSRGTGSIISTITDTNAHSVISTRGFPFKIAARLPQIHSDRRWPTTEPPLFVGSFGPTETRKSAIVVIPARGFPCKALASAQLSLRSPRKSTLHNFRPCFSIQTRARAQFHLCTPTKVPISRFKKGHFHYHSVFLIQSRTLGSPRTAKTGARRGTIPLNSRAGRTI